MKAELLAARQRAENARRHLAYAYDCYAHGAEPGELHETRMALESVTLALLDLICSLEMQSKDKSS